MPLKVLLVEDDPDDADLIVAELQRPGFDPRVVRAETEAELLAHIDAAPDVILADYTLPQFNAPHVLALLRQREIETPLIVVTGSVGEDIAVQYMRSGAALLALHCDELQGYLISRPRPMKTLIDTYTAPPAENAAAATSRTSPASTVPTEVTLLCPRSH